MNLKCVVCNEEFSEENALRNHFMDHAEEIIKRSYLEKKELSTLGECSKGSESGVCSSVPREETALAGYSPVCKDEEPFIDHSPEDSQEVLSVTSTDHSEDDSLQESTTVHNLEALKWGSTVLNIENLPDHSLPHKEEERLREKNPLLNPLVEIEYKRYQCHFCSKCFSKNGHLKIHLLTHSTQRPYKCIKCDKSFTQSGNLKRHLTTHINERLKQCTFCNRTFSLMGQLKLHILTHTDGRPYQCTVCEKSFIQKGDLNRHKLVHTKERPHECLVCNQKFKQSAHLKGHMLTHTGERPHRCSVCDKSYKESGHLKRHMQTHINDRPHHCSICDKSFMRGEHLKRHLLTHSNEIQNSLSYLQQQGDSDGLSEDIGRHLLATPMP